MNGIEAYTTYLAVRNHFKTKNYDYFKYNGKIKVNENSFRTRRDGYQFEKMARIMTRDKFSEYLVANFITEEDYLFGMSQGRAMMTHKKWRKALESFSYQFKEDIKTMYEYDSDFNLHFDCMRDGVMHPTLFKLYLREKVHINTCVVLNKLLNYTEIWKQQEPKKCLLRDHLQEIVERYSYLEPKILNIYMKNIANTYS